MSPLVINYFGPLFKEELILSFASFAKAIVDNIGIFRPGIQISLLQYDKSLAGNTQEFLDVRTAVEDSILKISPPCSMNSTIETCEEWYSEVESLIDNSLSVESLELPRDIISWF